jgi:hypothetical protein
MMRHPARRASRTPIVAACLLQLAIARPLAAQRRPTTIELFGTTGAIVGVTPLHVLGASRAGLHGGFRFDGGIQGERFGIGLGARLWELAPTQTFGGHGLDGFVLAEWREAYDAPTTVRAAVGAGFDEIDPGRGAEREHTGTSGVGWSIGIGREFVAPSGAPLLLSVDLVVPTVNSGVDGRRVASLEFGFAYRDRIRTGIAMPRSH